MGQEELTKCFGFLRRRKVVSQELAGSISISLGLWLVAAGDQAAGRAAANLGVCRQAAAPHTGKIASSG